MAPCASEQGITRARENSAYLRESLERIIYFGDGKIRRL